MSYIKQDFIDGQVLTATHMNHIESGIAANETLINNKQDILKSGVNIKTINGQSVLGAGNISISSNNNTGASGLTDTCKSLLLEILRNGVYVTNQLDNITLLEAELNSLPSTPSVPEGPEDEVDIKQTGSILAIYSGVTVTQNENKLLIA